MCEQYQHLLIATDPKFVPSAVAVRTFLSELVDGGFIPTPVEIVLRVPTGEAREFYNPFTGEIHRVPRKQHHKLGRFDDVSTLANELRDYEAVVSGFGAPELQSLSISVEDSYYFGATCTVSSSIRSMSHFVPRDPKHGELEFATTIEKYIDVGVFTNPHDGSRILVRGAGSARFWIEFELGKFLFPEIRDSLELLHPNIVSAAERVFGIAFAQGCTYG